MAEHLNYLTALGKIENPNFDRRTLAQVNFNYWQMRLNRAWNQFFG